MFCSGLATEREGEKKKWTVAAELQPLPPMPNAESTQYRGCSGTGSQISAAPTGDQSRDNTVTATCAPAPKLLRDPEGQEPISGMVQGESHHKHCGCNLRRGNLGSFSSTPLSVLHTLEPERTLLMGESEELSPGRNGEGDMVFGAGMGCDTQAGFPAHNTASRN